MIFTCVYRDQNGSRHERAIEASSRSDCFAKLKGYGINPLSVSEGGKLKSDDTGYSSCFCIHRTRIIVGAIVFILLSLVLVLWYWNLNVIKVDDFRKGLPVEDVKLVTKKSTKVVTTNLVIDKSKPLTSNVIVTSAQSIPHKVTNYLAGNRIVTNRPARVYNSATEQMLHAIFSTRLGDTPPPLPRLPKFEKSKLDEILNSTMTHLVGESEHVAEHKMLIDAARKELKQYIADGGNVDGFFEYYSGKLKQYNEDWKMSQRMAIDACKNEDPEVARGMIKAINEKLSERGIKPVTLPRKMASRIGLEISEGDQK